MNSAVVPRPAPDRLALTDYDRRSLAERLAADTGRTLPSCDRTAAKALRIAFRDDPGNPWTDASLEAAGVGGWARPTLLGLKPDLLLELAERVPSDDGTMRLLLRARDGALIESVIIPASDGRISARTTLCISSQVGCARACSFCETGRHGLVRHLSTGEIVDQVRIAQRVCDEERPTDQRGTVESRRRRARDGIEPGERSSPISNIVFMGMGEPLDNLGEVARAVSLLSDDNAFGIAPSRITVSTVGVADKLAAFFSNVRAELAISINAPDDARRSAIMPVNRRFDLLTLRGALVAALPPGRRVMFQYALFGGFNDSESDADRLAEFVAPIRCRVNVIPANPGPDPSLVAPSRERLDAFLARLSSHGVTTLVRRPRGRDVGGACGQLAGARRLPIVAREPSCA